MYPEVDLRVVEPNTANNNNSHPFNPFDSDQSSSTPATKPQLDKHFTRLFIEQDKKTAKEEQFFVPTPANSENPFNKSEVSAQINNIQEDDLSFNSKQNKFKTLRGAEKSYITALKNRKSVNSHNQLALYYSNNGKYDKAMYHVQQALVLDPRDHTAKTK